MFRTVLPLLALSGTAADPISTVSTGGSATSGDSGLGASLMHTVMNWASHPVTVDEAEEENWTATGTGCHPSLGIEYVPEGGVRDSAPLSAYYTPFGQLCGLKITIFDFDGVAQGAMISGGYYIPVESRVAGSRALWGGEQEVDVYEMSVSFRSPADVCAANELDLDIGDRVVINQHTIAESLPMTIRDADATGNFQPGACLYGMGQHYFKDVTSGSHMSFVAGNLLPITPMYYPPDDPDGKLNAFFFSWPGCQVDQGDAWDNNPLPGFCGITSAIMCQNFCNEECGTSHFDDYAFHDPDVSQYGVYHVFFSTNEQRDIISCPEAPTHPFGGSPMAWGIGRTCPANTATPDAALLDGGEDSGLGEIGDPCYFHDFCASGRCTSGYLSSGVCAEGTAEVGDACYHHGFCASGRCTSGTFSSGVCAECLSDEDCEGHGHSLPGIMPEAFCRVDGGHGVCSKWRRGRPIDEEGYPVWVGTRGEEPLMIRRHVVEDPPTSLVWRFELNNQPGGTETAHRFEANSTHISIPMNTDLLAGYSMSNRMVGDRGRGDGHPVRGGRGRDTGEHETGIASIYFGANPLSVVTPFPAGGAAEKYHTLSHEGPLDESRKEAVLSNLQGRSDADQQAAEDGAYRRALSLAAASGITGVIGQAVEAGQDVRGLQQLRSYVQRVLEAEIEMDQIDHETLSTEASRAFDLAVRLPSLKSMNQCTHFETREGLGVRENKSHFDFPLDSPIVFLKGIAEFAPSRYFGLNAGILLVHYDSDANILEFFFEMYQSHRMYPDNVSSNKNGLWIAPIGDQYPVDPVDGRTDELYTLVQDYGGAARMLLDWFEQDYTSIPEDYSIFDRSPTGTCDESIMESVGDAWSTWGDNWDPEMVRLSQIGHLVEMGGDALNLFINSPTCASSFLKGDAHEGLVSYGILEIMVYGHMILEASDDERERFITRTTWNNWDQFYKQLDNKSPKTTSLG